jgi:hypothetical protein
MIRNSSPLETASAFKFQYGEQCSDSKSMFAKNGRNGVFKSKNAANYAKLDSKIGF